MNEKTPEVEVVMTASAYAIDAAAFSKR